MTVTYFTTERQKLNFFSAVIADDLNVYSKTRFCCSARKFKACSSEERVPSNYHLLEGGALWKIVSPIFPKLSTSVDLKIKVRKEAFVDEASPLVQSNTTSKTIRIWLETYRQIEKIKSSPIEFFQIENASPHLVEMLSNQRLFSSRYVAALVNSEHYESFATFVKKAVERNNRQNLELCQSVMSRDNFVKLLKYAGALELSISKGHFPLATYLFNYMTKIKGVFTQEEKRKLFSTACDAGAVEVLESLYSTFSFEHVDLVAGFHRACMQGQEEVVLFLYQKNPYLMREAFLFNGILVTSFTFAVKQNSALAMLFLTTLNYRPTSKEVIFLFLHLTDRNSPVRRCFSNMPYLYKLVLHTWFAELSFTNEILSAFFHSCPCPNLDKGFLFANIKSAIKKKDLAVLSQEEFLLRLDAELKDVAFPNYDRVILEKFARLSQDKEQQGVLESIIRTIKKRIRVEGVPIGKEEVYYKPLEKILKLFAQFISCDRNMKEREAEIQTAFMFLIEKADTCYTGFLPNFLLVYRTLLCEVMSEAPLFEEESPIDSMRSLFKTVMRNALNTQFSECRKQKYDTLDGDNAHATAFMLNILREDGVEVDGVYVDNQDSVDYALINFGTHFDVDTILFQTAALAADAHNIVYSETKARFLEFFYREFSAQYLLDAKNFVERQLNQEDDTKRNEFLSKLTDALGHFSMDSNNLLSFPEENVIEVDQVYFMLFIQKLFHEEKVEAAPLSGAFRAMTLRSDQQ